MPGLAGERSKRSWRATPAVPGSSSGLPATGRSWPVARVCAWPPSPRLRSARSSRARLVRDGDPCGADLVQELVHLVEQLDAVLRRRLEQAPAHVIVELAEVGGELAAALQVEAVAQLADDRNRAIDQARLLGGVATRHATARGADALDGAVQQHHDQAMRVSGCDSAMRLRAAVGSEFCGTRHGRDLREHLFLRNLTAHAGQALARL